LSTDRKDTTFLKNLSLEIRGKKHSINGPAIMGILNITTDSFYDGGKYLSVKLVLQRVNDMLSQGADIIDLGAYSSRPGAIDIDLKEELNRVTTFLPIILKEFPNVLLSIDTFRSEVASEAVNLGASMVNDISAGMADHLMMQKVALLKVPYILMHMKGTPSNMQQLARYDNVEKEVLSFLKEQVKKAKDLGLEKNWNTITNYWPDLVN
jgi:dihydropteroate synthase